jgi:hypothetical protein
MDFHILAIWTLHNAHPGGSVTKGPMGNRYLTHRSTRRYSHGSTCRYSRVTWTRDWSQSDYSRAFWAALSSWMQRYSYPGSLLLQVIPRATHCFDANFLLHLHMRPLSTAAKDWHWTCSAWILLGQYYHMVNFTLHQHCTLQNSTPRPCPSSIAARRINDNECYIYWNLSCLSKLFCQRIAKACLVLLIIYVHRLCCGAVKACTCIQRHICGKNGAQNQHRMAYRRLLSEGSMSVTNTNILHRVHLWWCLTGRPLVQTSLARCQLAHTGGNHWCIWRSYVSNAYGLHLMPNAQGCLWCMLCSPTQEHKACNKAALCLSKAALWCLFYLSTICIWCIWFSYVFLFAPSDSTCCSTMHCCFPSCVSMYSHPVWSLHPPWVWLGSNLEPGTTGRLICQLVVGWILGWILITWYCKYMYVGNQPDHCDTTENFGQCNQCKFCRDHWKLGNQKILNTPPLRLKVDWSLKYTQNRGRSRFCDSWALFERFLFFFLFRFDQVQGLGNSGGHPAIDECLENMESIKCCCVPLILHSKTCLFTSKISTPSQGNMFSMLCYKSLCLTWYICQS